jgi:hypothetical protein
MIDIPIRPARSIESTLKLNLNCVTVSDFVDPGQYVSSPLVWLISLTSGTGDGGGTEISLG